MNITTKPIKFDDELIYQEASKVGLHLISPYVGKIRPALGRFLIEQYCKKGGILWDPFCG